MQTEQETQRIINFLVFDLQTNESWPRHIHYDEAGRKIPKERWLDRFRRLAQDNPGELRLKELVKEWAD